MAEEDAFDSVRLSDMRAMDSLTQSLSRSSESFGKSIVTAFSRGVVEGRRFEDTLRSISRSMTGSLLKSALKPLQSGISELLGSGVKNLAGLLGGGLGTIGGASVRSLLSPRAASSPRLPIFRPGAASA